MMIKKFTAFFPIVGLLLSILSLNCFAGNNLSNNQQSYNEQIPTPVVAQYYPIYNTGDNHEISWMAPNSDPNPPFDKTNFIILAFAHVYTIDNKATLSYENQRGLDPDGQPIPPAKGDTDHDRILRVVAANNKANPLGNVKVLMSFGDGTADWKAIYDDYTSGANNFPKSVVTFLQENKLDGIDIDFEGGLPSGSTVAQWTDIFSNIRNALDQASKSHGKKYLMAITVDGSQINYITNENKDDFDLINLMTYWSRITVSDGKVNCSLLDDILNIDPNLAKKTTVGLDCENTPDDVSTRVQAYKIDGLAGIFNWEWEADQSSNFATTTAMWNQMMQ